MPSAAVNSTSRMSGRDAPDIPIRQIDVDREVRKVSIDPVKRLP